MDRKLSYYRIVSKLLVGINLLFFIIIFLLKTQNTGSLSWFFNFDWLSTLNFLIDVSLNEQMDSNSFVCLWFIFTFFLTTFFLISNSIYSVDSVFKKLGPIDIDDLDKLDEVAAGDKYNRSVKRSFSETYTRAKANNKMDYQETAELLSGIPPDVAKKFDHLKDLLENITPKEKINKSESE
jgi:hypothetical protein